MTSVAIIVALATLLLGFACVGLVVVGLPGTWILLAVAFLVEILDDHWLGGPGATYGWFPLGAGLVLAIAGEVLEVASGVLGSKTGGGTKRGMWGAFLGGLFGALVGTLFIPVIGTIVGAIVCTFLGALIGELRRDKSPENALKPALYATVARLFGTMGKASIGGIVTLTLVVAALA